LGLLKDVVIAQHGGLDQTMGLVIDAVMEAIRTSGAQAGTLTSGSSTSTANSFRIQALHFLSASAESHSPEVLQPFLDQLLPALLTAVQDKYSKVSVEALATLEQWIKVLTPVGSDTASSSGQVSQILDVLTKRITSSDADLEVRQQAIHAMGVLLGRASSYPNLLPPQKRMAGLDLLSERLRNELTRLDTVRAVEIICLLARDKSEFTSAWVEQTALELGAQLRKSSRTLRGASLGALRTLAQGEATRANLTANATKQLVTLLLPILTDQNLDLHLLGPAFTILATFVSIDASVALDEQFVSAFGNPLKTAISGATLEALLNCVRTVGQAGTGKPLMGYLLQKVGLSGIPELTGKVIGNLLVAGMATNSTGVSLDAFTNELRTFKEDKRQVLALAVLGEAALRMGTQSPLQPQMFLDYFRGGSDVVPLHAAKALGRAGAGNVKVYVPFILSALEQQGSQQYLLLHSIREILDHEGAEDEVVPYAQELWRHLINASQVEDNKIIGAECIGRLAIIDPKTYLPQLQVRHSRPLRSNPAY